MKTISLFSLALCNAAFIALAVVEPEPVPMPQPPCCKVGLPPAKFSEQSIYSLDATWTADVGREVKLDALRGRPQVLALIFTNCQHSCALIVNDMKEIQKALPVNVRGKVDFLLVSIDPERDTPEALRAFRAKHALEIERWSLLRGDAEAVKKLAEMVGFRYMPGSEQQYAHSLLITVLNASGEIVYQQAGIGTGPQAAVETLVHLATAKKKASTRPEKK
jgi:protein SCO1/2